MAWDEPEVVLQEPWRLLFVWENLSSFGGVFGSALGGFYWACKCKLPLLPVYDCTGFGFPLAWLFGRLGCFVVHDHPGRETSFLCPPLLKGELCASAMMIVGRPRRTP